MSWFSDLQSETSVMFCTDLDSLMVPGAGIHCQKIYKYYIILYNIIYYIIYIYYVNYVFRKLKLTCMSGGHLGKQLLINQTPKILHTKWVYPWIFDPTGVWNKCPSSGHRWNIPQLMGSHHGSTLVPIKICMNSNNRNIMEVHCVIVYIYLYVHIKICICI